MKPITHFIVTLLLFIGFFPYYGYAALLVFAGGFLIDFDHYAYLYVQEKEYKPEKGLSFLQRQDPQ